jgi:hypothetical protein
MTATAAKLAPVLVTKDELTEIADAEAKHAKLSTQAAEAEREVKRLRQQLAEKVLGVKTAEDLKSLTPEQMQKLFTRRWEKGEWKAERGAPEFSFVESSHGRYPSWHQLYIEELGESAAAQVSADTSISWSYKVAVAAA